MRKCVLPLTLFLLGTSSCGPADNDPGPGGVNASDAKALDDAALKLDTEHSDPTERAAAK